MGEHLSPRNAAAAAFCAVEKLEQATFFGAIELVVRYLRAISEVRKSSEFLRQIEKIGQDISLVLTLVRERPMDSQIVKEGLLTLQKVLCEDISKKSREGFLPFPKCIFECLGYQDLAILKKHFCSAGYPDEETRRTVSQYLAEAMELKSLVKE